MVLPALLTLRNSVVVEAGCRSLNGKRCTQSDLFWDEPGAGKVLAFRLNSRASEHDTLTLAA
jgi:hypothetical protein